MLEIAFLENTLYWQFISASTGEKQVPVPPPVIQHWQIRGAGSLKRKTKRSLHASEYRLESSTALYRFTPFQKKIDDILLTALLLNICKCGILNCH